MCFAGCAWRVGLGELGLASWAWQVGLGELGLASWAWRVGFAGCALRVVLCGSCFASCALLNCASLRRRLQGFAGCALRVVLCECLAKTSQEQVYQVFEGMSQLRCKFLKSHWRTIQGFLKSCVWHVLTCRNGVSKKTEKTHGFLKICDWRVEACRDWKCRIVLHYGAICKFGLRCENTSARCHP